MAACTSSENLLANLLLNNDSGGLYSMLLQHQLNNNNGRGNDVAANNSQQKFTPFVDDSANSMFFRTPKDEPIDNQTSSENLVFFIGSF